MYFAYRFGGYTPLGVNSDDYGTKYEFADGTHFTKEGLFQAGYGFNKARSGYCFFLQSAYPRIFVLGCTTAGPAICQTKAVSKLSKPTDITISLYIFSYIFIYILGFSLLWPVKIFSTKESEMYFLLGLVNDIPKVSVNL